MQEENIIFAKKNKTDLSVLSVLWLY